MTPSTKAMRSKQQPAFCASLLPRFAPNPQECTRTRIDHLPVELLELICEALLPSHKDSVEKFALANRQCYRAATRARFSSLTIQVDDLADNLRRWTALLNDHDARKHVRQVVLQGQILKNNKISQRKLKQTKLRQEYIRLHYSVYEDAWLPIVPFLQRIPALEDVICRCSTAFPSCLLESPPSTCRIHVEHFSLHSLVRPGPRDPAVDSSPLELSAPDFALINCPKLYAISHAGHHGTGNHHHEAIPDLVAKCPSLRSVHVSSTMCGAYDWQRKPYPGLRFEGKTREDLGSLGTMKGKLTCLSLAGELSNIAKWQQCTEFCLLETLKLHDIEAAVLGYATLFADFPSLKSLELETHRENTGRDTARFLDTLPPLHELEVRSEANHETCRTICEKHGTTLRRLCLPALKGSPECIDMINSHCPEITHLKIQMPRTQGDTEEIASYTALGSYPALRTLHVVLNCSVDVDREPDGWYNTDRYDYNPTSVRRTLINSAIDEPLAAAIAQHIVLARAPHSAPLQTVELSVVNAGVTWSSGKRRRPSPERRAVYQAFPQYWRCDFDAQKGLRVTDQDAQRRRKSRRGPRRQTRAPDLWGLDSYFRELWPESNWKGDWRDDWSSFPLHEAALRVEGESCTHRNPSLYPDLSEG